MPITRSVSVSTPQGSLDSEREEEREVGKPQRESKKNRKKKGKMANKGEADQAIGELTRGELTSLLNDVLKQNGLDNIPTRLVNMQESLDSMQESLDVVHTKTDETEKRVKSLEINKTKKDLELDLLRGELALEKQARLRLECDQKRKNLILIGIKEEKDTENNALLGKKIKETFSSQLGTPDIMPDMFYRIGRKSKDVVRRPRPIMMTFGSLRERQAIWFNKGKLRESKYFIKEDFPQEIEEKRKMLGPIMREAKYQERRVKFVNDKLWIDDILYTTDNLYILPEYLRPKQTATKTIDGQIFYWGRDSPLSNFYPSSFEIDEINYKSVEEYYHAGKARFFGDEPARDHILSLEDPVKQKHVEVQNYNDAAWMDKAQNVMNEGMFAKFSQSKELEEFLLSTGELPLIEASPYDDIWGIGIGIRSKNLTKDGKWGRNWSGKELQKVRKALQEKTKSTEDLEGSEKASTEMLQGAGTNEKGT